MERKKTSLNLEKVPTDPIKTRKSDNGQVRKRNKLVHVLVSLLNSPLNKTFLSPNNEFLIEFSEAAELSRFVRKV